MSELEGSDSKKIATLLTLNNELENYFRNTIIPQLFVDKNYILRKFTPPAMRQFKLSIDDVGKDIDEIATRIRFPTFLENIKEVITTGKDFEKEIQTTDFKWFQMNILPYIDFKENKTNGVIITFVDITERIKNLKEIERLNADHETFIYSVSHDLGGPLSNLDGLLASLKELISDKNEDVKQILGMAETSVGNLRRILNDLSDVTRTRHSLTKGTELVSIENILEDVQLTLKDAINKTGTKITVDFNVSIINFTRKNIRSILYNLLSNAIKYKAPDRHPEINIKTEQSDNFVILSVTDNGVGIEKDQLKMIFSEFSRVSENIEGTGIGLYIVSKMIENSGGKIEVLSAPGIGSTFKIYFKSKVE